MTRSHDLMPGLASGPLAGQLLELRWSAAHPAPRPDRPARSVVFEVRLEPIDPAHALLEAWASPGGGPRRLVARCPVCAERHPDGDLLHVDVWRDEDRVLAVTLLPTDDGERRPLFARCALLSDAGIAAGTCDPPTLLVRDIERDAASA